MPLVRGEAELALYRSHWTGERVLGLLHAHAGRLLVSWPVGVGKSHNIDAVIETAARGGMYDLIVVLVPTRRLIAERRWVITPPSDLKVVNLRPRPRLRCGAALDAAWKQYEKSGLGGLGREKLCGSCPRRRGCFWPDQYGEGLKDAKVVFGTQTHLERSPEFLDHVQRSVGARHPLTILDEANGLMTTCRKQITKEHLERFTATLRRVPEPQRNKYHQRWLNNCELLLKTNTGDLRYSDWKMPFLAPDWSLAVQRQGWADHAEQFRFLGTDLQKFGRSPLDSREITPTGDLSFATPPVAESNLIVYSGTAHPKLTQFRLGCAIGSPFHDHRFVHPETRWFNIASRLGARSYFTHNASQVLDFFASLVARRLNEGHRPLLIAKKCFVAFCAREVSERLRAFGIKDVRVVTDNFKASILAKRGVIPLINFGAIGTNVFENFDCAYCLTGYYVTESVVDSILQDVLATDGHIPIRIRTGGQPRRRVAEVVLPQDKIYDVAELANLALGQQEMDVVIQAVGRVRLFTRPREIITFQCNARPDGEYDREFSTLGEARAFFGIAGLRTRRRDEIAALVRAARHRGETQKAVAKTLEIGLRTVKRYWRWEAAKPSGEAGNASHNPSEES